MFVFTYRHPKIAGVSAKESAMSRIRTILADANFSGEAFPLSKEYATWETDLVLSDKSLLTQFQQFPATC